MCLHNGIFQKGSAVVCPVDASGQFTSEVTDFSGQYVKVHTHCIINQLSNILKVRSVPCINFDQYLETLYPCLHSWVLY